MIDCNAFANERNEWLNVWVNMCARARVGKHNGAGVGVDGMKYKYLCNALPINNEVKIFIVN